MKLQTRNMAEDEVALDEECNRCDAVAKEVGRVGWTQSMIFSWVYWCPKCSEVNAKSGEEDRYVDRG